MKQNIDQKYVQKLVQSNPESSQPQQRQSKRLLQINEKPKCCYSDCDGPTSADSPKRKRSNDEFYEIEFIICEAVDVNGNEQVYVSSGVEDECRITRWQDDHI